VTAVGEVITGKNPGQMLHLIQAWSGLGRVEQLRFRPSDSMQPSDQFGAVRRMARRIIILRCLSLPQANTTLPLVNQHPAIWRIGVPVVVC